MPSEKPFVGRAGDRAALGCFLAQLRAGLSAALIVSGDAGMGKTRLLQWAADEAGIPTFTVSGYEAEIGFGFAALQRLLLPILDALPELPRPQREALATVFGLDSGPQPNRYLVGLATLSLLQHRAKSGPLLLVVDDAQWVDQESADALAFVARRLDDEPAGLLFGIRGAASTLAALASIPEHRLEPMAASDLRSLLLAAAPTPPAPDVLARLVTESEGNPLAILEHLGSLSAEQLAGAAELPPALPVSERLAAIFAAQVARLPLPTQRLLLLLSVAGPHDQDAVGEVLARLGIGAEAAWPAVGASVISPPPRLAFRHPLIRSVVHDTATLEARRKVYSVLADVAAARGATDAAAWHRAQATSGPDEQVAGGLERAAAVARARGGYAVEATFLTLAAERSLPGTPAQAQRRLAAARAHVTAGHGARAEHLLEGWAVDGTLQAQVDQQRAEAILLSTDARHAEVPAMLLGAADRLPAGEAALARRLLMTALRAGVGSREHMVGTSLTEVAGAVLSAAPRPGTDPDAVDLLYEGLAARIALGHAAGAPILRRALHTITETQDFTAAQSVLLLTWLAMEDLWDDAFESTTWPRLTEANRAVGALPSVWVGLASSAVTRARHGDFAAAEAMFDEVVELSVAVGADAGVSWSVQVEFRAWQGREAETREMAATMIREWSGERRYASAENFALTALTLLDLSLGNYAAALTHARRVADDDPPGHGSRILPELVEAAVRTGDTATAHRANDELTRRATAVGTPWALGLAARTRALVLGASADAAHDYDDALRVLGATAMRAETARTQLLYGEWLRRRRRRRDAREHLTAAWDAFTDMGATLFAKRAADELAAAGAPTVATAGIQRPDLTPQERRVAELAALGLTNGEISQRLFLSESTIDHHLSRVFRKLQIGSRRQLLTALAR